jgi:6-pyruvoyltetrahydropterin/6-carboxytetrahydropterin synthase
MPLVLATGFTDGSAMLETFVEFTFEAAHQVPPYSGLHGHSFIVVVYLTGEQDPIFGWSHNLYEVEMLLQPTQRRLNNSYLNDIQGLEVPSLENIAAWIWHQLDPLLTGLDRVLVRRGVSGASEGCAYSGRAEIPAKASAVSVEQSVA